MNALAKPFFLTKRIQHARETIKQEAKSLGFLLLFFLVLFLVLFAQEPWTSTTRTVVSIFLFLVLPGYIFMLQWKSALNFAERIVIGTTALAAGLGVFGYVLGLFGIGFTLSLFIVPAAFCVSGILLIEHSTTSSKYSTPNHASPTNKQSATEESLDTK